MWVVVKGEVGLESVSRSISQANIVVGTRMCWAVVLAMWSMRDSRVAKEGDEAARGRIP